MIYQPAIMVSTHFESAKRRGHHADARLTDVPTSRPDIPCSKVLNTLVE